MSQSAPPRDSGVLPSLRTRLYGRERDRDAGVRFLLVEAVPLLTVTGPGGVGKTSLALAIAHYVKSSFADGAVWVDLTPVSNPEQVPARIASALGVNVPSEGTAEAAVALVAYLRTRQSLMLLDNCEQVAASVGELFAHLLPSCPAVQVLATSRAPLNIRFEQRLRVDPLTVPGTEQTSVDDLSGVASVQLFLDRARARQPRLPFDASNAASIADLCRHLEGMPLAIELTASQVNAFPPEALLAMVQAGQVRQPTALVGLPERQRSIAATIAWSYELLSSDGQTLYRRLSVFAGGCTLEAAQAVAKWHPARTTRALNELVDSSLIASARSTTEPRFGMLESMRTFALERLRKHGEEPFTRNAHATHFTDYFARSYPDVLGSDMFPWLQRFDREFDNIRTAFSWLLAQKDGLGAMRLMAATDEYWAARRHRAAARSWAEAALRQAPDAPAELRAAVFHIATFATRSLGDFPAAIALAEQGLAASQQSRDLIAIGRAYYQLGNAWHHVNIERAIEACKLAVDTFRQANNVIWLAVVLADLGDKLRDSGDFSAAVLFLDEGLALNRENGYPWGIAQALAQRAHAARLHGDAQLAANLFAECISLAQEIGDEHMVMGAVVGLAGVTLDRGFPVASAILLGAVDAEQQSTGWPRISHPIPAARIRQAVKVTLDDRAWAAATTYGRTLPFVDAVATALTIATGDVDVVRRLERVVDVSNGPVPAPSSAAGTGATSSPAGPELSWRELEILTLLCQRSTNAEMAQALFVSPRTIESHVSNILSKLQVRNRREAAALAVKRGMVALPRL